MKLKLLKIIFICYLIVVFESLSFAESLPCKVFDNKRIEPEKLYSADEFITIPRVINDFIDLFQKPREVLTRNGLTQNSLKRSRSLIEKRKDGVKTITHRGGYFDSPHISHENFGVPEKTRLVIIGDTSQSFPTDPLDTIFMPENTVFRHYTTPEKAKAIEESHLLIPGNLPLATSSTNPYVDMKGAFLVIREERTQTPDETGVFEGHTSFVDFRFPRGTGLVVIKSFSIHNKDFYMVPGISKPANDDLNLYEKWIKLDRPTTASCNEKSRKFWKASNEYDFNSLQAQKLRDLSNQFSSLSRGASKFLEVDKEGGFPFPSLIPIEDVRVGLVADMKSSY